MKHLNLLATLSIIVSLAACGGSNPAANNNQNNNNNVPVATPTPSPIADDGVVPDQDAPVGDNLADNEAVDPLAGKADPEYVRANKICTAWTDFKGVNICDKFSVGYIDPTNPNAAGFTLYRHFSTMHYPANHRTHANEVIGIPLPPRNSNEYLICYDDAGYAEQGLNENYCEKITVPAPEAPDAPAAPANNNNNNNAGGRVVVIGENPAALGTHTCPVGDNQKVTIPKSMTCTAYYKLRVKCADLQFRFQNLRDCRIVEAATANAEAAPANNNAANNHNFDDIELNFDTNMCHWDFASRRIVCGEDNEDEEESVEERCNRLHPRDPIAKNQCILRNLRS